MNGSTPTKIVALIVAVVVVIVGVSIGGFFVKKSNANVKRSHSYSQEKTTTEPSVSVDSNYEFNSDYSTATSGNNTSTEARTNEKTTTASFTTKNPKASIIVLLERISIQSYPNTTTYYLGDGFSSKGLTIKAHYSDGSSKDVTSKAKCVSPNMHRFGSQAVKVEYSEDGITKETDFNIQIRNPQIVLSNSELTMSVGDTVYLSASTDPSNCHVSWSSSSNDVVTVSGNGKVTAVGIGISAITASFTYRESVYHETCIVEVENVAESDLCVLFYDGTYDSSESNSVYLYDLEGSISSNYNIESVSIGVLGPVYINGNLVEIDQYESYTNVYELGVNEITLEDLADYYGDGFTFDIIDGECYTVYVYAEDSSGTSDYDYFEIVF